MTTWHRFTGKASQGRFACVDPHRLKAQLQEWEGREIEVAVRIARRNRTLPQNSYIHVLLPPLKERTGYTELELKRRATLEALGVEGALIVFDWNGQTFTDVRGTSELTSAEASKVVDVLLRQTEFNELPIPNPEHYEVMP